MEIDEFVSDCFEVFTEHVQHIVECPSTDIGVSFLQSLSFAFVRGGGLALPQHMKAHVFRHPRGNATVILAGKFSIDENYEIRRLAKDQRLDIKSNAAGETEGAKLIAALKRLGGVATEKSATTKTSEHCQSAQFSRPVKAGSRRGRMHLARLAILLFLVVLYALSIGPALRLAGGQYGSTWAKVYWPHASLCKHAFVRTWMIKWCDIWDVPSHSVGQVLGLPLQTETLVVQPETPPALPVATSVVNPTTDGEASPPTSMASPAAMQPIPRIEPSSPAVEDVPAPVPQEVRIWTDARGRKIEARLIKWDDQTVEMLTSNGKVGRVPLSQLSKEDQEFLRSLATDPPSSPLPDQ